MLSVLMVNTSVCTGSSMGIAFEYQILFIRIWIFKTNYKKLSLNFV